MLQFILSLTTRPVPKLKMAIGPVVYTGPIAIFNLGTGRRSIAIFDLETQSSGL